MDVWEIERPSSTMFRVRAESEAEAEALVDQIRDEIGTLMVDLGDWRFREVPSVTVDVEDIVEIYAEVY